MSRRVNEAIAIKHQQSLCVKLSPTTRAALHWFSAGQKLLTSKSSLLNISCDSWGRMPLTDETLWSSLSFSAKWKLRICFKVRFRIGYGKKCTMYLPTTGWNCAEKWTSKGPKMEQKSTKNWSKSNDWSKNGPELCQKRPEYVHNWAHKCTRNGPKMDLLRSKNGAKIDPNTKWCSKNGPEFGQKRPENVQNWDHQCTWIGPKMDLIRSKSCFKCYRNCSKTVPHMD